MTFDTGFECYDRVGHEDPVLIWDTVPQFHSAMRMPVERPDADGHFGDHLVETSAYAVECCLSEQFAYTLEVATGF
ncbi:hypothetical protein T265_02847 [Opisthorchis viverrini]|uniref:Uncharacterized protein n=1 Tax=Opisthorchis viverrini TaxID=6198 RepID=A0A074ZTM0_OPIVI|nr:hypothetical protein T265_02847 [Opisthorchis viverrini]KER30808.1 hypothetical protein T265_02847 [Opisthorchis viverrini]